MLFFLLYITLGTRTILHLFVIVTFLCLSLIAVAIDTVVVVNFCRRRSCRCFCRHRFCRRHRRRRSSSRRYCLRRRRCRHVEFFVIVVVCYCRSSVFCLIFSRLCLVSIKF